ncbi:hypothetical protein SLS54_004159 [Diplodia seriata]
MASSVTPADICWGTSKKTNRRCANKAKIAEPGYLPTCHQHRDQLLRPGSCQYLVDVKTGARCKRRFVYDPPPPYFELCPEHVNTPQGPCHFLRLPVELRMEVYKYFLKSGAVLSSHPSDRFQDYLPLLLVNKQIGSEAQDHLYASTTFHIEVGQQGATISNRYLYRPCGAEHRGDDDSESQVSKLLDIRQQLNFSRVKNIKLEVSVVNSGGLQGWSEEVEMYDLRDSISAILPYLARAQNLHKLTVRVVCSRFDSWTPAKALANFKLITQPLMSLRNITRPLLEPPYTGMPFFSRYKTPSKRSNTSSPFYSSVAAELAAAAAAAGAATEAGEPILPPPWTCPLTDRLIPISTRTQQQSNSYTEFLSYKHVFESITASAEPIPPKPPIARMFSAFKRVYLECASLILSSSIIGGQDCSEMLPSGADNFLHRARVARENVDLDAFVEARNGFVRRWNTHLEQRYCELARVNGLVVDMYNADAVGGMGAWDPRFSLLEGGGGAGGSVAGLAMQQQQQHQPQQRQLASPPAESGPVGLTSTVLQMSGDGGEGGGRMAVEAHGDGPWVAGWDWNCSAGGGGISGGDGIAPDCDADMAMVLKEEEGTGYGESSMFASGFR